MRGFSVEPRPARDLVPPAAPGTVLLRTAALGFLGALEDDRRRWLAAFRRLLDGLDHPLQAVLRFRPGPGAGPIAGLDPGRVTPGIVQAKTAVPMPPPTPDGRREADLAFAAAARDHPTAQRREVLLVTTLGGAPAVERALAEIGLAWTREPPPEPGSECHGVERPDRMDARGGLWRAWWLDRWPGGELDPGWLARLAPTGVDLAISWHATRLPGGWVAGYLQRQLAGMRASRLSGAADPLVEGALPRAEQLQRALLANREHAFHVAVYVSVRASTAAGLAAAGDEVEGAARAALCTLLPCSFRMADGVTATLPLGRDPLVRRRVLDSSSLATLFPWLDADLQQPSGVVIGRSRATGAPVLLDPFDDSRFANANVGVFGHSGAGKTYLLSTLAMGALGTGAQVYVIDPEHEYGRLAESLGGLDVRLALGSGHALNVFDLHGAGRDEASLGPAVADAIDLCDAICGGLDEPERADLELAVRAAFADREEPLLGDVASRLAAEGRVGRVLRRWVGGSLGRIFSAPTTVDLDAPIVVFGMRELRQELVGPVHFLLAEALWARIRRRDRRRLLVVDELGLLFEDPTIRRFVVTLARRIRKYDGSLVFATQNPGDLLASEAGAVVASNPAIHLFGAQRPGEAARLQRAFQLSDTQRTLLESARRGEFLLSAGPERLAVRVQAPPWQEALIRAGQVARPPPGERRERHGRRYSIPGAPSLLGTGRPERSGSPRRTSS